MILILKMLFIDFQGSLTETCVKRSTRISRLPGHFPRVTVTYRCDCRVIAWAKLDVLKCTRVVFECDARTSYKTETVTASNECTFMYL